MSILPIVHTACRDDYFNGVKVDSFWSFYQSGGSGRIHFLYDDEEFTVILLENGEHWVAPLDSDLDNLARGPFDEFDEALVMLKLIGEILDGR